MVTTSQGPHRPSTSLDVAQRAGVSRSTVSNILNGRGDRFPTATRERVLAAAAELDYRPSLAGRTLVSGRSDTVVLLVPNTTFGSNLQDAVDAVVTRTRQIGGNVVVRFASPTATETTASVAALQPLAVVDFGVLSEVERDEVEQSGAIVVPGATRGPTRPLDAGIGALQAQALLASGPRTLWFAALSDARSDPYGPARLEAIAAYCRDEGLPSPRQVSVPLALSGATRALAHLLRDEGPVGVACYNDDVAIALLAAARSAGVDVPSTLAVVGVDHTQVGQLWTPPLTTVDTDLPGHVSALASELSARLDGRTREEIELVPPRFTLVEGGTT